MAACLKWGLQASNGCMPQRLALRDLRSDPFAAELRPTLATHKVNGARQSGPRSETHVRGPETPKGHFFLPAFLPAFFAAFLAFFLAAIGVVLFFGGTRAGDRPNERSARIRLHLTSAGCVGEFTGNSRAIGR